MKHTFTKNNQAFINYVIKYVLYKAVYSETIIKG